jgi:hypothetical protein
MAGNGFDDIAKTLEYADRSGAHKAVMTAIENTLSEPAEAVRQLELKRLNALWLVAWKKATRGNMKATTVCLQIMKRRADFEGLDKAKKREFSGPGESGILGPVFDQFLQALVKGLENVPGGNEAVANALEAYVRPSAN